VQAADFDPAALQRELCAGASAEGAIVTFTGYVRGAGEGGPLHSMELEHYPGMTERSIESIMRDAGQRWSLLAATVVHRIGRLLPGEQIVWVGVASRHRGDAFSACECIMDYLKCQAPFWKKEMDARGGHWVDAREQDENRAARWRQPNE
jgi:molybdopterin synthase catalytic subunit